MEEWKDIPGYEGLYQVSNQGRIYSFKIDKYLKLGKGNHGYKRVTFCKNGEARIYNIHRLVAEAFIPNPENKPQVDHIDGNKLNNNVANLRWSTAKENNNNPVTLEKRRNNPNCGGKRHGSGRKKIITPEYKPETNFYVGCSYAQREKLSAFWQTIKKDR